MDVLATVTLPKKSGIPQDAVQNSFAFNVPTGDALDMGAIANAVNAFYNVQASSAPNAVNTLLAPSLSTVADAVTIKMYDISGHLGGTAHGSPIHMEQLTLSATAINGLPDEVAACVSFHSSYGGDVEFGVGTRPRARDRGRFFIGPLGTNVMTQDGTTNEVGLSTVAMTILAAAAADLANAGIGWSVWSRRKASLAPVVAGWVDNAFDTQRRRGNDPSVRQGFDLTGLV